MKTSYKVLSVSGLVVGLIALVMVLSSKTTVPAPATDTSLGGVFNVNNVAPGMVAGVDYGPVPVNVNYFGGKIGAKTNTAFYKNTSGSTQYIENVEVATDGTASSTYTIYAYATSTAPTGVAATLYDFKTPVANATTLMAIKGYQIATSSLATTTSSDDSLGTAGPTAGSVIQLANNSYLIVRMTGKDSGCASSGSGVCETATSSNRGFNLQWRVMVHN